MIRKKYFILLFFFCFIFLISLINFGKRTRKKEEITKNISVIMRGEAGENWRNMKQGMEQASFDMGVNIRFVNGSKGDSYKEQISSLYQEKKNGADAIVLIPIDYQKLKKPVEKVNEIIPVVLVESTINSKENYGEITCDNLKIGYDLAKEVFRHGNTRKVILILKNEMNCSSILERIQGFKNYMKTTKNQCIEYSISNTDKINLKEILDKVRAEVIVCMDTDISIKLAKANKDLKEKEVNTTLEIYGIGNGNEIVSYLENNYMISLVAVDDFSIGYLGIKNAVKKIEGKKVQKNYQIQYTITDQEHMYSKKNQRLLFPFVK